jgi:hypothetical protein
MITLKDLNKIQHYLVNKHINGSENSMLINLGEETNDANIEFISDIVRWVNAGKPDNLADYF